MRQRADGIQPHDTAMIENLLKLGRRFRIPTRGHERLAAHVGRVQTAEIKMNEVQAIRRQFIAKSDLQPLHAVCGLTPLQCGERTKNRHIGKFNKSIFREASFPNRPASASDREESPEKARARPAAYSTSRPLESLSAAIALLFPSAAFPETASHTARAAAVSRCRLAVLPLAGQDPWRGSTTDGRPAGGRNEPEQEPPRGPSSVPPRACPWPEPLPDPSGPCRLLAPRCCIGTPDD